MSVTFKQKKDGVHVIESRTDHGLFQDVIVNHAAQIVEAQNGEGNIHDTLPFKAAAAIGAHFTETVNAAEAKAEQAEAKAEQAEERAADLEQFRPATDDEIEREARAQAEKIKRRRKVEARAKQLADEE